MEWSRDAIFRFVFAECAAWQEGFWPGGQHDEAAFAQAITADVCEDARTGLTGAERRRMLSRAVAAYMQRFAQPAGHLWPCGCLVNDADAHRKGCPVYPEGRPAGGVPTRES
jgi:hypothetical protein